MSTDQNTKDTTMNDLPPGERRLSPITSVDAPGEERRNDLSGAALVPTAPSVGWVDASTDASTQQATILIDAKVDLTLDTFVVTAQRLVDDTVLFHYGLVDEVSGRVEGAEMPTDTARLAQATLPGQRYRTATVQWIRTHPEKYLPPSSGAPVWIAEDLHRARALFLDKMDDGEAIPLGLDLNGSPVFAPFSFLNGERGAHVSISGKSGVATKTSYALFLLHMLFETRFGLTARQSNPSDRALIFSVKGADLCLLDKRSNVVFGGDERGQAALDDWARLGIPDPQPFGSVAVFAPAEPGDPGTTPVPEISVRDRTETTAYGWSPLDFVRKGLLEYVFDDLESGQLSFIEQVVRVQLLRWAYPVIGGAGGALVMTDPDFKVDNVGSTWESAGRRFSAKEALAPSYPGGVFVQTLDDLVGFIASKVDESSTAYDEKWTGRVSQGTVQAFVRRLWKATPRLRRLVRTGLTAVDPTGANEGSAPVKQVSVVDVHSLHVDAQRFVVASVLADVWATHENSTAPGRTFVLLDELNKYAPRQGDSPIKSLLIDIAARGRSLGVILIGAQQNPSGVAREILNNAAIEVVGQIKQSESGELGFLPPAMRARATTIPPGTMITSQPLLPAPVPIRFPFPPYATRLSEVLGSSADAARAAELFGA